MSHERTYKIVLAGARETGKSAFLERHVSGQFLEDYVASREVNRASASRIYGVCITLDIWDVPGDTEYYDGTYYNDADAVLVFVNPWKESTYNYAKQVIRAHSCDKHVILCIAFSDDYPVPVVVAFDTYNISRYWISSKNGANCELPITSVLRRITAEREIAGKIDEIVPEAQVKNDVETKVETEVETEVETKVKTDVSHAETNVETKVETKVINTAIDITGLVWSDTIIDAVSVKIDFEARSIILKF